MCMCVCVCVCVCARLCMCVCERESIVLDTFMLSLMLHPILFFWIRYAQTKSGQCYCGIPLFRKQIDLCYVELIVAFWNITNGVNWLVDFLQFSATNTTVIVLHLTLNFTLGNMSIVQIQLQAVFYGREEELILQLWCWKWPLTLHQETFPWHNYNYMQCLRAGRGREGRGGDSFFSFQC